MTKVLEALKTIKGEQQRYSLPYDEEINIMEQALLKAQEQEKVLEIIIRKQVDINLFITIIPFNKSIEELTRAYNQCFIERCRLTIEETTLLKRYCDGSEVTNNEI